MTPDPTNLDSFNHQSTKLSTGRTYHYVDQLPANYDANKTVTLLLVHGFPDLWASWKNQIVPWVQAGYRVVAPDMLGYGQTEKPDEPEEYSFKKLSDDLAALLDHVGSPKAVLIGHDWGSFIAGRFVLWHPQRVLGITHISVSFYPPNQEYVPLEDFVKKVPDFAYQLYFSDPATTKKIEDNIEFFYRSVYTVPNTTGGSFSDFTRILDGEVKVDPSVVKTILSDEELKLYTTQNSSFRGPLNYYRTTKIRFDEEKAGNLPPTYTVKIPVLFLRGTADRTSPEAGVGLIKKVLPQTKVINYEGAGHWLMHQNKENVAKDVLSWLSESNL